MYEKGGQEGVSVHVHRDRDALMTLQPCIIDWMNEKLLRVEHEARTEPERSTPRAVFV